MVDAPRQESAGHDAAGSMEGDAFSLPYVERSDSHARSALRGWVRKPAGHGRFRSPTAAAWEVRHGRSLRMEPLAWEHAGKDEQVAARDAHSDDGFGGHQGLDHEVRPMPTVG